MIHFLPKAWREKFVAEHPIQAILFVAFGCVMMGITLWLVVTK